MAKKLRKRIWWLPFFESEKKKIELRKKVDANAILFDDPNAAFGYMAAKRLDVQRDEDGNIIMGKDGYAKLKNRGKIHLIAFEGKNLNWKEIGLNDGITNDSKHNAIIYHEELPINLQTVKKVFEESDQMFNMFANTPLAKAGGVKPIAIANDTDGAEESSEPSAESSHTEA